MYGVDRYKIILHLTRFYLAKDSNIIPLSSLAVWLDAILQMEILLGKTHSLYVR